MHSQGVVATEGHGWHLCSVSVAGPELGLESSIVREMKTSSTVSNHDQNL